MSFRTIDFRGKSIVHALLTIPFVMPTVVVATAFMALLGRNGVLNRGCKARSGWMRRRSSLEQTIWIILIAHVFYNVTVIVRTVGGFWSNLNPHLGAGGRGAGGAPWRVCARSRCRC